MRALRLVAVVLWASVVVVVLPSSAWAVSADTVTPTDTPSTTATTGTPTGTATTAAPTGTGTPTSAPTSTGTATAPVCPAECTYRLDPEQFAAVMIGGGLLCACAAGSMVLGFRR